MRQQLVCFETLEPRHLLAAAPLGATHLDTGELLLGSVSVTPVFFNSTGETDAKTQNWSTETNEQGFDEIDQVMQRLGGGLDWWVDTLDTLNTVHTLDFQVDSTFVDSPFDTKFEPIDRNGSDFIQYVTEFVVAQGYSDVSSIEEGVRRFNEAQRIEHGTDWAFTIFVVDASDDQDGQFAPGSGHRGAFAFAGGLFMVIPSTRDADIFAHELGHVFWAMDEYQFGATWQDARGYYNGQVLNAADNPAFDQPGVDQEISIMRGFTPLADAYDQHVSPASTLALVGWQDSDGDGVFDVADVPLELQASGYFDSQTSLYHFQGTASAAALLNQNSSGPQSDITLNRISQIQYRLDGGDWIDAASPDQQVAEIDLSVSITEPFESIQWRALDSVTGITSPIIAGSMLLPAIASASVSGLAFVDSDADGGRGGSEPVLQNTTIVLRNSDGSQLLSGLVDAADQEDGFLSELAAGVTIGVIGDNLHTDAGSFLSSDAGNRRVFYSYDPFADEWSAEWSDEVVMTATFDQPVGQVTLDVVGIAGTGYGRMDAFDADGNFIARATSASLAEGELETVTVSDTEGRIASIRAYGHAKSVVSISKLTFGVNDTFVTGASGAWSFPNLADGQYIAELVPERVIHQFANSMINVEVSGGTSEMVMAGAVLVDSIRHNAALPEDSNGLNGVSSLDALVIINDLGRNSVRILQPHETDGPNVDVNNDGMVSALDALLVINFLGRQDSGSEAESTTGSELASSRQVQDQGQGPIRSQAGQMLNYAGSAAPSESNGVAGADRDDQTGRAHPSESTKKSLNRTYSQSAYDIPIQSISAIYVQTDAVKAAEAAEIERLGGLFASEFEEPFADFTV